MNIKGQNRERFRTGRRTGIWLALFLALGLHVLVLLLPVARNLPDSAGRPAPIELQFTTIKMQQTEGFAAIPLTESSEQEPAPEAVPLVPPEKPGSQLETETATPEPVATDTNLVMRKPQRDLDNMSEPERRILTNTILARQFITEESAVDLLFGRSPEHLNDEPGKEFHYPVRPDLISMLDKPLPDVPFDYTPGLIYFAYDPGVKGDLQRFWDVITPEFGWRTRYGTEVRCVLVLVLVGCGWK